MIRFKKEYTPLATLGRVRLGIARIENGRTSIEVIKKRLETNRLSYDVCISRGNGWTWCWDVPYEKIQTVIDKANLVRMDNEF